MKNSLEKNLRSAVTDFLGEEENVFEFPNAWVEYPKNKAFGDYTTSVAISIAKKIKKDPMDVAEAIRSQIKSYGLQELERIEVAAPGHINFYLSENYLQSIVGDILEKGEDFGSSDMGRGDMVNNEFISANPTGPLHLGNGRGGFFGDSLTRVLRKSGFEVSNEYYINDAGEQILKLGHSVLKDDQAVYEGEYVDLLNAKYAAIPDVREVGKKAAEDILEGIIKKTVGEKMQISFDEWKSERQLIESGVVERAISLLGDRGLTYESDGALWLRTSSFGDDKDRVLIKSDGQKTYFASDCGYILDKMERGFKRIIEIWGADHHGYIERFSAAAKALEFPGDLRIIIVQLVRLVKDGKEVRMSKRAGNIIYIDDLIEELGHDVSRFFFLMYSPDTHMNFDLGLAREKSSKNPVFYVQYAHARICSILGKARDFRYRTRGVAELSLLVNEKELDLMRELAKFPELVEEISQSYEVHKLPYYAIKLADKLHSFYDSCRVIDDGNSKLTEARLALADATRSVLAETLRLIGVSTPDKM